MWNISRNDLITAEEKSKFLEIAYQLDNNILEARRYEKNFLLYKTPESFEENNRYINEAENTIISIYSQLENLKALPMLQELARSIHAYQDNFAQLNNHPLEVCDYEEIVSETREIGQQMTAQSANLLAFERSQVHLILRDLGNRIHFWSLVAISVGILLPIIAFFMIFKPLNVIKKAVNDIANGKFKRIEVLNTRDEMQQVMEAFNTMVDELERRQDQLVQSKKLSSIGTLTAGVAHQLNNPLNNISTSCQIALDDLDAGNPDLIRHMLRNIDQETLRARDVVKGLLEFSRVQEFKLRPANLADVAARAIRLVQSQVPADISTAIEIPPDLMVPMDVQRIQEVFLNLIINAAQAIEHQGAITISAKIHEPEDRAVIEVHDTGPGVPKEIQGQLFDPFYTTKDEGMGTGLGLSVVYGIIQKHHGEITVASEPGQGTSFFISLPLSVKENPES